MTTVAQYLTELKAGKYPPVPDPAANPGDYANYNAAMQQTLANNGIDTGPGQNLEGTYTFKKEELLKMAQSSMVSSGVTEADINKFFKSPYYTGNNGTLAPGPNNTSGGILSAKDWLAGVNNITDKKIKNLILEYYNLDGSNQADPVFTKRLGETFANLSSGTSMLLDQNTVNSIWAATDPTTVALTTPNPNDPMLAATTQATVNSQVSAFDSVQSTLQSWNFSPSQQSFINGIVKKLVTSQGAMFVNPNAVLEILRGNAQGTLTKAEAQQVKVDYENAFPGLTAYNSSPSAVHMSEVDYNVYTKAIQSTSESYGAPMPTAQQIGQLLNGRVSAVEYQKRVVDIYTAVQNAPQNVKNLLASEYGVHQNDLMSYFANPKNALPSMQRQVATAQIQDYGQRVGLTGLNQQGAEQLGDMARLSSTAGNQLLGYGVGNVQSSLLNASRDAALTSSLPGNNASTIDTNTLIGSQLAGFQGTNQPAAQLEVARAEQVKAAPFEKGGGYQETNKGITGLGSART